MSEIKIPDNLKPADGRFGCGPSKILPTSLSNLANNYANVLWAIKDFAYLTI